jgi:hypothetical protein
MVQPAPIEALNHWTFRFAQLNGQAVALKILIASVILNFLGCFGQIFGTVWRGKKISNHAAVADTDMRQ